MKKSGSASLCECRAASDNSEPNKHDPRQERSERSPSEVALATVSEEEVYNVFPRDGPDIRRKDRLVAICNLNCDDCHANTMSRQ